MKKLKIVTVLGTRPEIIRLSCVIKKLDKHCEHILVHTGQNYDYELNEVFFNDGPKEQTTWGGICKTETESTRVVQSEKIDNLFDLNSRIDVLKIDTEGADFLVLCGAERLLKNKLIKNIFFEMNKPRMKLLNLKVEDALKYLDSMDYSCSPIGALNNEVMEYHAEPR